MPDLTTQLLPDLHEHKLPGLDLGDDFIYPKYDGQSILNIPATICKLMNIPIFGESPLRSEILTPLGDGVQRVILILMDALALHRLQRWINEPQNSATVWKNCIQNGLLAPLTSISPSTTSAALTTLWTGRSPSAHGILGYEVWLKEYGVVTNMILHTPATFKGGIGNLSQAGFKPQTFLPVPTFGPHLRKHGVMPHAFQHHSIAHSGLSQMFMHDVNIHAFETPADLWISLRQQVEGNLDERMYAWTYWGHVDGLSHFHGPEDQRPAAEFSQFSAAFENYFLNQLSPEGRKNTMVILTADHGQIHTPLDPHYSLKNHPELNDMLHMQPTGENRLMYLYIRPGKRDAVKQYFESNWPGQFVMTDSEKAIQSGLFGPSPAHPNLFDRSGDLIAVARDNAYLWWAKKDDFMYGRHGGLHRQEMLVPFLAVRL